MKVLQERIDEITTLIAEVANGNFDYKLEVSETGDELDAVIFGVNMLGQELKNSTVSRDVMQSIYQGVVDMLLVLNQDFTIRNVNEAIEEMLGFQEADLLEKVFTSLLDPSEIPLFSSYMETLKRHGKCRDVEIQLITAKGDAIPTSCSFSYLRNNLKQIEGILIIAKDISKIKETERELKEAKDKAVNANEAKSRFLSSMSHEIRTPLNGIMGFTDLLLDSELNRTQTQYANLIKTSGKTLTKLLSDILDLNKIEQDKISFEMVSFDIRDSIISNLAPYKHIAESKKISYSYTFD
ncbi:MAG: histidine kinase dimerization/phospho-acceptor domain-containing protein [Cyclobacteriaceae bacterium]